MSKDQVYMRRALELARLGLGTVSPNPMVGCVIVHENQIVGEGWHQIYGGPHAEVNAIANVTDKEILLACTVYVNLEPCAHFGKTPPCADLLVAHQVKRVVVANVDPNPLVGGKGIKKLEAAGIEVVIGVLEHEGQELNKRFFRGLASQRPYVILKWAETSDGFIARANYDSKWISSPGSRMLVHKWRAEEDAIMVGANTALYDDPQLTVRDWSGRDPLRIVIDRNLRLPDHLKLFTDTLPTLRYNLHKSEKFETYELVRVDAEQFIDNLLHDLYTRGIRSVIVEGGSAVLHYLIDNKLWDEARVFVSRQHFGEGIRAPKVSGLFAEEYIEDDKLLIFKN